MGWQNFMVRYHDIKLKLNNFGAFIVHQEAVVQWFSCLDRFPRASSHLIPRCAKGRTMTATLWLASALACAQVGLPSEHVAVNAPQDDSRPAENIPPARSAVSKIVDVTVYQGQALVTREVSVPAGDGTVELVVTPCPRKRSTAHFTARAPMAFAY